MKKPYNPVLGEIFRCRWKLDDGSESFYVAEQVSHHPPISAYYFANPTHRVVINGFLAPKSKFLGNSAASIMEGRSSIRFLDRPDEEYIVTMPNMYARGILFGTMIIELCDNCTVKCEANDLKAELEFKAKVRLQTIWGYWKAHIAVCVLWMCLWMFMLMCVCILVLCVILHVLCDIALEHVLWLLHVYMYMLLSHVFFRVLFHVFYHCTCVDFHVF